MMRPILGSALKGRAGETARLSRVRGSVEELVGLPVVRFSIDGLPMLGAFSLCAEEHERRLRVGIGAVTCRALLHGLWLLPSGGSTPHRMLPDMKLQRLRQSPQVAIETGAGFVRTYEPPGVLRLVVFQGQSVERAVDRAARFSSIVQRFALIEENHEGVPPSVERLASEWGVGIIGLGQGHSPRILVQAGTVETGVPSVYRWWLAELVYKSYLREHPSG